MTNRSNRAPVPRQHSWRRFEVVIGNEDEAQMLKVKKPAEQVVKDIRRKTGRPFCVEDKIRIALDGRLTVMSGRPNSALPLWIAQDALGRLRERSAGQNRIPVESARV